MHNPLNLKPLIDQLELEFRNPLLLRVALTHRSFVNEHPTWSQPHNERLEFLGDQVLGLIVKDFLYDEYSQFDEGVMTQIYNNLVNNYFLAEVSIDCGLPRFVLLSNGEAQNYAGAHMRAARALEALIGAVYKDQGLGAARLLVDHLILRRLRDMLRAGLPSFNDPKSRLQEITQAKYGSLPVYDCVLTGEGDKQQFECKVVIEGQIMGLGFGRSQKKAQLAAANVAISKHFTNTGS
jgi:ribonuclease-3